MTDELLAYLLDDLCPERRAELERRLAQEPALRRELARLDECLAATGEPAACVDEPPRDLLKRTCGLVERVGDSGVMTLPTAGLPGAALSACEATGGVGSRWSLADCVVGVGVIGVLGMLMLPAMRESRDAARRRVCADNLRAVGTAVLGYTQSHGPYLAPKRADLPTAMLLVELVDRGGVNGEELARAAKCPDSQAAAARFERSLHAKIPSRTALMSDNGKSYEELLAAASSIAFQGGYFQDGGRYRGAKYTGQGGRPLAADAPVVTPQGKTFVEVHCGMANVLDEQLCVKSRSDSYLSSGRDNIYQNNAGVVAAGNDPTDSVVIEGNLCPDGLNHFPRFNIVSLREGQ